MTDARIGIVGAAGRMGLALVREIASTPGAVLGGGIERAGHKSLGLDLGALAGTDGRGVLLTDDALTLFAQCDAVIYFTSPKATAEFAGLAAQSKCVYIVGTTGLEEAELAALRRAAAHTAIVQSFNMSLGVNLIANLVRQVAGELGPDWDIEIVEMHHRMKVDAPSGTALLFGAAAAKGRGIALAEASERGRDGIGEPRQRGAIGFASLRGGNVVGDHSVIFAADNERVELTHKAGDRTIFARGAVRAALWAQGKPPGLYGMSDVLGF